jgi:hypothetical protein
MYKKKKKRGRGSSAPLILSYIRLVPKLSCSVGQGCGDRIGVLVPVSRADGMGWGSSNGTNPDATRYAFSARYITDSLRVREHQSVDDNGNQYGASSDNSNCQRTEIFLLVICILLVICR